MSLKAYFENTKGVGILSTADGQGTVDAAIYAKPEVFDDGTVGFIMRERLSHANVSENPKSCYLFLEDSPGYQGKRLYLTKTGEEKNSERLNQVRRAERKYVSSEENLYLVTFSVDEVLPLVCRDDMA